MSDAKYGYVITRTPGLVSEGSYPLTVADLHGAEDIDSPYAIFGTVESAKETLTKIVPEGKDPICWDGLTVETAWQYITRAERLGIEYIGVAGFIVPDYNDM